ncbi:MAG: hypothetical protein GY841_04820 [FCB group bacterium]|nr:hypothetical protein [FCB group bacterium]
MTKRFIVAIMLLAIINLNISCTGIRTGFRFKQQISHISARELRSHVDEKSKADQVSDEKDYKVVSVTPYKGVIGVMLNTWEVVSFDSVGAQLDVESNTLSFVDKNGTPRMTNVDEIQHLYYSDTSSRIFFDGKRGKIDAEMRQIIGTTDSGQVVAIPIEDVLYMEAIKPPNIPLPIAILVLAACCVLLYKVIESIDIDFGEVALPPVH